MSDHTGSATELVAIDISSADDELATGQCRGLLVGVAGNVKLTTDKDSDVTIPVIAGWNPVEAKKIFKVGTTATGLFAYY